MFNKLKGNPTPETSSVAQQPPSTPNMNTPTIPNANTDDATPVTRQQASRPSGPLPGVVNNAVKPSIISEDFTIRGDIESEGTLHVEGRVIGLVKANTIHISSTGQIEGDVVCQNLSVKGKVTGTVVCSELALASSARVKGHLSYRSITVGRGARIECDVVILS
jgi:cytoskeletal protein CcmA (bactofilin family)